MCFDDVTPPVEYKIFGSTLRTFSEAAEACELEEPEATLGRVSTTREFFHVLELGETLNHTDPSEIWIGVEVGVDEESNAGNYFYVDGFKDKSFFEVRERFPWGTEQPNNARDDDCVTMTSTFKPGAFVLWNNADCNAVRPYLCRRNCTRNVEEFDGKFNEESNDIAVIGGVAALMVVILLFGIWEVWDRKKTIARLEALKADDTPTLSL